MQVQFWSVHCALTTAFASFSTRVRISLQDSFQDYMCICAYVRAYVCIIVYALMLFTDSVVSPVDLTCRSSSLSEIHHLVIVCVGHVKFTGCEPWGAVWKIYENLMVEIKTSAATNQTKTACSVSSEGNPSSRTSCSGLCVRSIPSLRKLRPISKTRSRPPITSLSFDGWD